MKVAALYDIHGNLPALEAVLHEVGQSGASQIVVGGDVIVGPMSRECLERLLEIQIPIHFIQGNCETSVLAQMKSEPLGNLPETVLEDIRWTAGELQLSHRELMAKWPMTINLEIKGLGSVLFCHATPRNNTEIFTRFTPEDKLLPIFEKLNTDIVVCGHTHMQFERNIGKIKILNAGSVGMPYGKPGAYWVLIGNDIKFCHTSYDAKNAAELILKTSYPHAKDFAENNVLNPQPEEAMLEIFSGAELK